MRSTAPFEIDDYTRWRLLEGLDDIGITLSHEDDIATYEVDPAVLEARHPLTKAVRESESRSFPKDTRENRVW